MARVAGTVTDLPFRRALVTGASGFVGANLVERLCKLGAEVHALTRGPHPRRMPALAGARPLRCDLADRRAVLRAVEAVRPEVIFHLGAEGTVKALRQAPQLATSNVLGTGNLLEAAEESRCARFVHVACAGELSAFKPPLSSAPVTFGSRWTSEDAQDLAELLGAGDEPKAPREAPAWDRAPFVPLPRNALLVDEGEGQALLDAVPLELPPEPTVYASTKAAATLLAVRAAREGRVSTVVLRPAAIYGPWDAAQRLVPAAIRAGLRGETLALTRSDSGRDLLYVDDLVEACLAATRSAAAVGQVFELGWGSGFTNHELVAEIELACGEPIEVREAGRAEVAPRSPWAADPEKPLRLLGWAPRVPLPEGLARTVDWFVSHPERL